MKKIEITTSVENGRLKRNSNVIKDALKSFEGKTITIILKPFRRNRSNNQNRYYWGVIIPIWQQLLKNEWGEIFSLSETHEFLKYNCNYTEKIVEDTGEIIRFSKSTTINTTVDQEEFHIKARSLAFEMFNTEIPLPNEQINLEV